VSRFTRGVWLRRGTARGEVAYVVETIAEHILSLHGWVALAVVFLLPALEASAFVGFLFPGEIAVILGGVLAFQGRISLPATLAVAIGGAVVGDTVGYWVGRRWGRRMLEGSLGRFVKAHHIDRAERYLADRGGGKAVFFGRFTAALRVMIPGLAGMAGMRYRSFLLSNLSGGAVWATVFVLLGYVAGTGWRRVEALAKRASLVLLLLAVVIGGIVLGARWIANHPERSRAWTDRQLSRPLLARFRVRRHRELEFLARRFRPEGALGLSLTVAVLALVTVAVAFGTIALDVLGARELALVDQPVSEFFLAHREAWLTRAMSAVTTLGGGLALAGLVVAVGLLWRLRAPRSWRALVLLASVQLGALASWWILKAVVPRVRPANPLVPVGATETSFPSAHAVDAAAVYCMLAALLAAVLPQWGRKVAVWATAVGLVAVIGLSRLYLGASWLTDVLGGAALGTTWMLVVWTTAQTLGGLREARRPPRPDEPPLLVPGGDPDQERDAG
jgi:membrane protein DedA with SNARE-associated domain/membrane-associated phospholipid phosphatase